MVPLTQDQVDALVEVVEGELRGLFLLILLTRRSAREIVRLRRDAVVPLVKHLMEYFVTAHCTAESDALLFPQLALICSSPKESRGHVRRFLNCPRS
jgi:hypothetical protein